MCEPGRAPHQCEFAGVLVALSQPSALLPALAGAPSREPVIYRKRAPYHRCSGRARGRRAAPCFLAGLPASPKFLTPQLQQPWIPVLPSALRLVGFACPVTPLCRPRFRSEPLSEAPAPRERRDRLLRRLPASALYNPAPLPYSRATGSLLVRTRGHTLPAQRGRIHQPSSP